MPSNKNKDLKKQIERTGKQQLVFHSASICPAIENGELVFKIMQIGFTLSGECVTLEEVDRAKNEASAFAKLQMHMVHSGALDLKHLRNLVKQVKEDENAKKAK